MSKKNKLHFQQMIILITGICLGVTAGFISYSQVLRTPDEFISNYLYQYNPFEKADSRITIITLDSEDTEKYSDFSSSSRNYLATAIDLLNDNNASVIGLDLNLTAETNSSDDAALVESCKKQSNVVVIAETHFDKPQKENAQITDEEMKTAKPADSSKKWLEHTTTEIDYPFDALREVVSCGVGNAMQQSHDGTIRNAALSVSFKDNPLDSFAVTLYKKYQDLHNEAYNFPELDNQNLFGFNNIINTSSYQTISFTDLLSGSFDSSIIQDHIVLVGKYNSNTPNVNYFEFLRSDYAKQEVLLQSSILQAIMNNRIIQDVDSLIAALIIGLLILFLYLICARRATFIAIIIHIITLFGIILTAGYANYTGYRFLLLVPSIFVMISLLTHMLHKVVYSTVERKRMEHTLKLYVDSQIVDEISEVAPFQLGAVSERRDVAILFVDIRGFTTLSEELPPEDVVKILNDYFSVVYASVIAWNGTIDKFIGDAAMAIFNAPKNHPDYIYHSVCAADDIIKGFQEIKYSFKEKYGKDVAIGIGINSGEALVGNIGCIGRMDYTAIGDTVNTASRLESKASPGQILISESVKNALPSDVEVSHVGDLTLKGKTQLVPTYEVTKLIKPSAPNEVARKEHLRENYILHTKIRPNR